MLELNATDFGTAQKAADAINHEIGPGTAQALDARVIEVKPPANLQDRVGYLARIENIEVTPSQGMAKVVINARTGSVVMNQTVRINECAVAHGNLTVVITTDVVVSQPNPLSAGSTVITKSSQVDVSQSGGALQVVKSTASLADVVKGLNALGANPQDLVSILQSMKAVGALRAELEII
jgi:flagellar P-ring protein precursor FlgI